MPRSGRKCTVCTHPALAEINKALLLQSGSKTAVSGRYGVSPAAVQRHRSICLGHKPRKSELGRDSASKEAAGSVRFENGRCPACGTLTDDPSPKVLVKRAERVLFFAESIMQKAVDTDDSRLGLMAVDRARASLEQLLKVHGLLQPDGVNTTIDNRKQVIQVLGGLSEAELRALVSAAANKAPIALKNVTDNKALAASKGTIE